mmetsp:Transcript_10530/g.33515  ORF Transcript_10530/g.33515 Transcript_10530/m.33515 type:complete len:169 (-) Transcript_10530:489-995(-)
MRGGRRRPDQSDLHTEPQRCDQRDARGRERHGWQLTVPGAPLREGSATCLPSLLCVQAFPPCWDHNASVVANADCLDGSGNRLPSCITVGYSQNAIVAECGNEYADSRHCGTFLELHSPGALCRLLCGGFRRRRFRRFCRRLPCTPSLGAFPSHIAPPPVHASQETKR